MPTIKTLITQLRGSILSLTDELAETTRQVDAAKARCQRERRAQTEDPELVRLEASRRTTRNMITQLEQRIAELTREQEMDEASDMLARQVHPVVPGGGDRTPTYQLSGGERQYREDDAATGQPTFLGDLYRSQVLKDPKAGERLARHGAEVERDDPGFRVRAVTTSAVSGFVPPAYLTELWAELARAGRPVADLCTRLPLPDTGMTVNVPRVTTGTLTGVQAAQGDAVANQDLDDTLLSVPVVTIAGYVDVSRQAVERGVGVEALILGDLAADYNSKLDAQVINGSGVSGQHKGILQATGITTVTYTDASPTIPEMWPKLADLTRQVVSQRFTGPTGIVMSPLHWGWITAQLDTANRPLVDMNGTGANAFAIGATPAYPGSAGTLQGVPVYLSGNVPANLGGGTNETRIIAADFRDLVLFEDNGGAPLQLRFNEPLSSSLGVRLVAYGFSAFTAERQPKAVSVLAGTGLITPAL